MSHWDDDEYNDEYNDLPREGDFTGLMRSLNVVQAYECKFCNAPIHFKDRVPYEANGNEHRCITARATKYACYRCNAPITFSNRKPMNTDGSPHRCIRSTAASTKPKPNIDPETGEILDQGSLL